MPDRRVANWRFDRIAAQLIPILAWLFLIALLRWQWTWSLIGFWLGGVLGTFLMDVDHLLYLLIIYPQELTSLRLKDLLAKKDYSRSLALLLSTEGERTRLPFHNILLQLTLVVVCLWVVTSSGSLFGVGLVMAMFLRFLIGQFKFLLKGQGERLRQILFWPITIKPPLKVQNLYLLGMLMVFLWLSWLLI